MYMKVTFMVEAASEEQFWSEPNENAVASALPGRRAWLVWAEEDKSVTDAVKAAWKKLRSSDA